MSFWRLLGLAAILGIAYLALWPVPVDPVAWSPKEDPGLETGPFAATASMSEAELIDIGGHDGPEDFAIGPDGALYTGVDSGAILRLGPGAAAPTEFANTGGRPLGLDFGPDGVLYIADAYLGLLAVDPNGVVRVLAKEVDGAPIPFADDLAVAGRRIFFSDASTRFGALESGGTLEGSLLEILEHRRSGRILEHDLDSGETRVLTDGLSFANGVALAASGDRIIVAETGAYRLLEIPIDGPDRGRPTVLIDNLPGFPDNVELGPDGLYWVGLTSPRLPLIDALAEYPALRKVSLRLPVAVRPGPLRHGLVVAVDPGGAVRAVLQDPSGRVALTSGALRTEDALYIAMLKGPSFARMPPPAISPEPGR